MIATGNLIETAGQIFAACRTAEAMKGLPRGTLFFTPDELHALSVPEIIDCIGNRWERTVDAVWRE